jgi:hypothetical protein
MFFFGHATQSIPFDSSLSRSFEKPFRSSAFDSTNRIAKSRAPRTATFASGGRPPSKPKKFVGSETSCTRVPGFIPSLSMSGVPE